ncbi:MAG: chemotaxis protein CheW [Nitrospirae bacterium]|nr:chemotaxis protein CheW [Nitrospirota bacterium]
MDTVSESAEQTQYLTFVVAGEACALSLLEVKEIIEYDPTLTTVPAMPPSLRGVINVRGNVVPVIDLAVKFGLPSSPITKRTCVVIVEVGLEGERCAMGVIADSVSQVLSFSPYDIVPLPAFGTRIRMDYLKGLGKIGKHFVLILDLDRVLSFQEFRAA